MDLQEVVTENRFEGMWRLLRGYRWIYTGAILGVGVSAIARTVTYLLLGYFVGLQVERLKELPSVFETTCSIISSI
jgi:hypothetical protein